MFFEGIENNIKIPMCVKYPSSYEMMCRFSCKFLNSGNNILIDRITTKFIEQLIIIYFFIISVGNLIRIDDDIFIYFLFLWQISLVYFRDSFNLDIGLRFLALWFGVLGLGIHGDEVEIKEIIIFFLLLNTL